MRRESRMRRRERERKRRAQVVFTSSRMFNLHSSISLNCLLIFDPNFGVDIS